MWNENVQIFSFLSVQFYNVYILQRQGEGGKIKFDILSKYLVNSKQPTVLLNISSSFPIISLVCGLTLVTKQIFAVFEIPD